MALSDPLAEFRLDGEVAVVTGGASGIGEVVARALTAVGARVAVFDLAAKGEGAYAVDVTSEAQVTTAFAEVARRPGRLDVLLNNAGIAIRQPTTELSPMGRFAEPEELVGAVPFLASRASAMVTGHVLAIDGGFLAQ